MIDLILSRVFDILRRYVMHHKYALIVEKRKQNRKHVIKHVSVIDGNYIAPKYKLWYKYEDYRGTLDG